MRRQKETGNRYAKIMAWIVAALMVFSVLGVVLDYSFSNRVKYGKQAFQITSDGKYVSVVDGKRMSFSYFPSELETMALPVDVKPMLGAAQVVLVTFNSSNVSVEDLYYIDFVRFRLSQDFSKDIFLGIEESDDRYPLPIISCSNASAYAPIIKIELSNETGILSEGPCITIKGEKFEIVRAYERFLYGYYGVMP